MIHAGAKAGIYELRDMAFESVEGFLRAGQHLIFLSALVEREKLWKLTSRERAAAPSFFVMPGCTLVLTYFTPQFLDWLDEKEVA